jgi:hypothetical protein
MSTQLFAILLILLLVPFFVAEPLVNSVFHARDVKMFGVSLLSPEFRTLLGIGIAICEMGIVLLSIFGRIGDAISDIVRPLLRVAPLVAFFTVFFKTFKPILTRFFPSLFGSPETEVSIAQAVNNSSFNEGVLLTVAALVLFMFTNGVLSRWRRSVRFIEE